MLYSKLLSMLSECQIQQVSFDGILLKFLNLQYLVQTYTSTRTLELFLPSVPEAAQKWVWAAGMET